MALEIEHKYLVKDESFKAMSLPERTRHIEQGYLSREPERTVRVRYMLTPGGEHGFITVKGITQGASRQEYEYEVPAVDARAMLALCEQPVLVKTRYIVPFAGYDWEIDCFGGELSGLILAEIELPGEDARYELPPFVGENVTGNPAYYNSALCAAQKNSRVSE